MSPRRAKVPKNDRTPGPGCCRSIVTRGFLVRCRQVSLCRSVATGSSGSLHESDPILTRCPVTWSGFVGTSRARLSEQYRIERTVRSAPCGRCWRDSAVHGPGTDAGQSVTSRLGCSAARQLERRQGRPAGRQSLHPQPDQLPARCPKRHARDASRQRVRPNLHRGLTRATPRLTRRSRVRVGGAARLEPVVVFGDEDRRVPIHLGRHDAA